MPSRGTATGVTNNREEPTFNARVVLRSSNPPRFVRGIGFLIGEAMKVDGSDGFIEQHSSKFTHLFSVDLRRGRGGHIGEGPGVSSDSPPLTKA